MSVIPAKVAELPWRLLFLILAIGGFGLVVLYSAAGGKLFPWAGSQGVRFVVFIGMAIALSRIRLDTYQRFSYPGYLVVLFLLIAVELVGGIAGGSQRWLDLGVIRLQPSELMKLTIVLAVAQFFDRLPTGELRGFNALWPPAVMIGLPFLLVILQPDLGTALMIAFGGVVVVFLAGVPLRLFVGAGTALAAALPIVYALLHDYQRKRVLIFLDPESDPLGAGYHITQSKIAIGSGGVFGKGFLQGSQSHLKYLPEPHTDFVFATMAEEWGLFGGVLIITGFLLVIRWAMKVGERAPTRFGRLTACGLATTIWFYMAINLMMVMGLAPVVGIPLPLVSFGGTAMMTVMMAIGVLMSIDRAGRRRRY